MHALRNLEQACLKAKRLGLYSDKLVLSLKDQSFKYTSLEVSLNRVTNSTLDLVEPLSKLFNLLFEKQTRCRATSVTLSGLTDHPNQFDVFEDPICIMQIEKITRQADALTQHVDRTSMPQHLFAKQRQHGQRKLFNLPLIKLKLV